MPSKRICEFCNREFLPGTGLMLVRNDGSIHWLCSSKCRINAIKLHRKPLALKWTRKAVSRPK